MKRSVRAPRGKAPPRSGSGDTPSSALACGENERLLQEQSISPCTYAEALFEAAPPLLLLNRTLRVKAMNAAFCNQFGVSEGDVLDRPLYELGGGEWNIPALRTTLRRVLSKKTAFDGFELTLRFKNGSARTLLLSGHQVNQLERILLFVDDITDRMKAQAAIKASEIRYRRLFEAARDGILILDPESRKITDANPFMAELLGHAPQELLGKELWEIGLLRDEKASRRAFRELQKKRFIRYEDLPLQDKAGHRREVEFVSNLYEEGGRKVIQCNIRDVTERKRAEEALRESEEKYRTLFNSIDEGFCTIEVLFDENDKAVDYRFLEVNPSFEKQTGIQNARGRTIREILPLNEEHWFETYGRIALTGEPVRFENSAAQLHRWFDVYAFRIGEPRERKVAVIFNDITERKQADAALLRAKNEIARHALDLEQVVADRTRQLRATISELEGFSYSVAHDMRAPLRAMQSFASFLLEEYGSKFDLQGTDYLQQITRSAARLDRLILDVLSYSRILHTNLPVGLVDVDRLARDIVAAFRSGETIQSEIQILGASPKVVGNEALLGQCLTNLLSNAVKFVAPGTIPHVVISFEESGPDWVRLCFKDNGIGIAPENHERIFRLFEKIHSTSEYGGTGLGLTIVRKAAERMGAQVGFESELGKGSKFWIQLKKG